MLFRSEWGRALLTAKDDRLLVAVEDGRVVGAATVGPAADPHARDSGEIGMFVVDPDRWRRGHGSRLLMACVEHLRQSGYNDAVTWIPVADEARRAFLVSAGWGPDGSYRDLETIPGSSIREVRLVSDISVN